MRSRPALPRVALALLLAGGLTALGGGGVALAAPAPSPETCTLGTSTIATCFPDPVFAAGVADSLGVGTDAIAVADDLDLITTVDLNREPLYKGADSLEGVQHLRKLQVLTSSGSALSDLSPLAGHPTLTQLNLDNNQISDVSPLASLTQLRELNLSQNLISDVSPLASLPQLQLLNIRYNQIRDASMLTGIEGLSSFGNGAVLPPLSFSRGSTNGSVILTSGVDAIRSNFAARYNIDGKELTYSYTGGNGSSSWLATSFTARFLQRLHGVSIDTVRGDRITSTISGLTRVVERAVTSSGSIVHTITMTNPGDAAVTTRFYDLLDVELNGNDKAPLASDGFGGFTMSDDGTTLYLQPLHGMDATYALDYFDQDDLLEAVETGGSLPPGTVTSAGIAAGTELFNISGTSAYEKLDTVVSYVTPLVTLTPGMSYSYSYREALYTDADTAQILIDFLDEDTGTALPAEFSQALDGAWGTEITLDAAQLELPAGYMLSDAATLPLSLTFGVGGPQTTVQIPVRAIPAPTLHTVTFDSQGGSAVDPLTVTDGELFSLPSAPSREGFDFVAWTTDADGTTPVETDAPVTADLTLYAQWAEIDNGGPIVPTPTPTPTPPAPTPTPPAPTPPAPTPTPSTPTPLDPTPTPTPSTPTPLDPTPTPTPSTPTPLDPTPTATPTPDPDGLAATGTENGAPLILGAGAILALGGGLLLTSRRRRLN